MSDLTRTIDIVFGARNEVSPVVGDIESSFNKFEASVDKVAQPLAAVADQVLKTEAALLALAAAFTGAAIDAAGRFGDSINEIGTLFSGNQTQIGQFSGQVLNYASTSTQSLESINAAIYKAVSAGSDYQDVLGVMASAEQLSVAGRADLESVTIALTGTMNAYGASTEQASQYSDTMFTAVKSGNTTMTELAASLGQVTGIAAGAGVPFSTLAAAVSSLTAYGEGTSQAITGIKAAISNIIAPSGEAAKAAEKLGIEFDANALKSKGLEGVLKDVMTATGGNIGPMTDFFGSVEGLNVAMKLGKDASGKFAESLDAMAHSSGATQAAFAIMANNYALALQKMANAADVALIKAGQPLLDEFGSVANGIAAVFKSLGTSIDAGAFEPIINALEAFGQSFAATLQQLAQNLPEALSGLDFSGLIASLQNLGGEVGEAFQAIFGNIDLSTPEGLSEALQLIVDGITALTNVTSGIVDGLEPVFSALGGLARSAETAGEGAQQAVGQFLGAAELIVTFGTKLGGALIALQEYGDSLHLDLRCGDRHAPHGVQCLPDCRRRGRGHVLGNPARAGEWPRHRLARQHGRQPTGKPRSRVSMPSSMALPSASGSISMISAPGLPRRARGWG